MLLVKCKCGCLFSIKETSLSPYNLQCQNCKEKIHLWDNSNVLESAKEFLEAGITVSAIPDDAKITVTFDA